MQRFYRALILGLMMQSCGSIFALAEFLAGSLGMAGAYATYSIMQWFNPQRSSIDKTFGAMVGGTLAASLTYWQINSYNNTYYTHDSALKPYLERIKMLYQQVTSCQRQDTVNHEDLELPFLQTEKMITNMINMLNQEVTSLQIIIVDLKTFKQSHEQSVFIDQLETHLFNHIRQHESCIIELKKFMEMLSSTKGYKKEARMINCIQQAYAATLNQTKTHDTQKPYLSHDQVIRIVNQNQ